MTLAARYAFLQRLARAAGRRARDRFPEPRYPALELSAWDAMAGLLLVEEAGGSVWPFPGPEGLATRAPVLAAAPGITATLGELATASGWRIT